MPAFLWPGGGSEDRRGPYRRCPCAVDGTPEENHPWRRRLAQREQGQKRECARDKQGKPAAEPIDKPSGGYFKGQIRQPVRGQRQTHRSQRKRELAAQVDGHEDEKQPAMDEFQEADDSGITPHPGGGGDGAHSVQRRSPANALPAGSSARISAAPRAAAPARPTRCAASRISSKRSGCVTRSRTARCTSAGVAATTAAPSWVR